MPNRKKQIRLSIIAIVRSCVSILLGLATTVFMVEFVLEVHMDNSYQRGQGYFNMANYQMAEKSYRSAIFLERHLVLTDDNSKLPVYYRELSRALMNRYQYEEMYQYIMASFDAFIRFRPDDAAEIASTDLLAIMACSLTGRDAEELEYAQSAYAYFSSQPGAANAKTAARIGAWLGHCYYEAGEYSTAYDLFQENLPTYYEGIDWGVGDESEVNFSLMTYKCAMLCEEKLPYLDDSPFTEQFQRLLYIREQPESEIDNMASQLGWAW